MRRERLDPWWGWRPRPPTRRPRGRVALGAVVRERRVARGSRGRRPDAPGDRCLAPAGLRSRRARAAPAALAGAVRRSPEGRRPAFGARVTRRPETSAWPPRTRAPPTRRDREARVRARAPPATPARSPHRPLR